MYVLVYVCTCMYVYMRVYVYNCAYLGVGAWVRTCRQGWPRMGVGVYMYNGCGMLAMPTIRPFNALVQSFTIHKAFLLALLQILSLPISPSTYCIVHRMVVCQFIWLQDGTTWTLCNTCAALGRN